MLVVLAVLGAVAVPTFASVVTKSKDGAEQTTLHALGTDVQALADLDTSGTITAADITTAVGELPSATAAGAGMYAAG